MFAKLLKHEYRATAPLIVLCLAAMPLLSFLWKISFSLGFTDNDILDISFLTSSVTLAAAIFAACAAVFVSMVRRFNSSVFGDEGYFTLTLPVTSDKIILSKFICAVSYFILTALSVFLSIAIIIFDDPVLLIKDFAMDYFSIETLYGFFWLALLLMKLYFSLAVGQLFTKHRFWGAILGFIIAGVIEKVAKILLTLPFSFTVFKRLNDQDFLSVHTVYSIHGIICMIIFTVLLFFGTKYIIDRKMNLQ